jgi:preprotein translocase subunit YajC
MVVALILLVVVAAFAIHYRRKADRSEVELKRIREHLAIGDAVRLQDGRVGRVTYAGKDIAILKVGGEKVMLRKDCIEPLILN